jgi:hypothetical protein
MQRLTKILSNGLKNDQRIVYDIRWSLFIRWTIFSEIYSTLSALGAYAKPL